MGFEFSYLSAQDESKTVETLRFVAKDFPVYVIGRTTQSFGPFEVTTVQAVIAPMDTEWPESGGLDLSDAILTFTDGSEMCIRDRFRLASQTEVSATVKRTTALVTRAAGSCWR